MAVRSRVLALLAGMSHGTWVPVVTVPGDRTAIVKAIALYNNSDAAKTVRLRVRRGGTSPVLARWVGIPSQAHYWESDVWLALDPGDILEIEWTGTGSVTGLSVYVAGSLLEGVPT